MDLDHEARWRSYAELVDELAAAVEGIPGVRSEPRFFTMVEKLEPEPVNCLVVHVDAREAGVAAADVERTLEESNPRVAVHRWDDTLIVCGSEFGRTPVREVGGGGGAVKRGRDHNPFGFTMWLAGGAVKGGTIYGATDEFGYSAIENPVDVHDLHATMLQLLGIQHTRLSVKFQGLDVRLTGIAGKTIQEILA